MEELFKKIPREVRVTEVGPRDGLQNESKILSTDIKIEFIRLLAKAGVSRMEVAAFVRPDQIPQMENAGDVCRSLHSLQGEWIVLVPNLRGFNDALDCGVKSMALFTSTSDTFNKKNINAGIEESLVLLKSVAEEACKHKIPLRGHISTAFACPYEGTVAPHKAVGIAESLLQLGVDEIVLGDTIGVANPKQTAALFKAIAPSMGKAQLTFHFHDTLKMGIANVLTVLELGGNSFDASVGGIGGCPYAKGASGNISTESLVYLLEGMGVRCGIDLDKLTVANEYISKELGRIPNIAFRKKL